MLCSVTIALHFAFRHPSREFLAQLQLVSCRLIRAHKNRYGALEEVGVFSMGEKGLAAVPNPSALFLSNRDTSAGVSSAVTVQMEGTRPMLMEVQALCSPIQVDYMLYKYMTSQLCIWCVAAISCMPDMAHEPNATLWL